MERRIHIKKPLNLESHNKCFFQDDSYTIDEQNLYEIEDGTITNEGVCFIGSSVIYASLHAYRDEIEFGNLSSRLSNQMLKTIHLNDSHHYLHIQGPQFSYYHWFTDSLPRLWALRENQKETVLILPEKLKDTYFVRKSIDWFNISNIYFHPSSKNLKVKHLLLPQIRPFYYYYDPEIVCQLREYITDTVKNQGKSIFIKKKPRIFISNSFHEYSSLANWHSLVRILIMYDIEIINISGYSLINQIRLMKDVEVVVSFNHEYLTCMSFMKPGSLIYEIGKYPEFENDRLFHRYWSLASALDIRYSHQFLNPGISCKKGQTGMPFIDLNLFEHDLKAIL